MKIVKNRMYKVCTIEEGSIFSGISIHNLNKYFPWNKIVTCINPGNNKSTFLVTDGKKIIIKHKYIIKQIPYFPDNLFTL